MKRNYYTKELLKQGIKVSKVWECPNNNKGICLLGIAWECKYNHRNCKIDIFTDFLLMIRSKERSKIEAIRTLIAKANYSCGYSDKFSDFMDDLKKILEKRD